ncbi:hypothetical protein [Siphonobacter sp. SORGH_AS_1065]|uniref:hypothetical protein n=1 Tax=Siphonobacter sp. SORGH_AS_1065 TaxID=3041795 RepID=UPI002785D0C1|nr:hypothetical protein [Siphonobacter sp. SORGH_AS_1065]MDQ1085672.1 hypothetical protein [Siphonobacter sp. SORGH_AS_1065]
MVQKLELEIPVHSHWIEKNGQNWLVISPWRQNPEGLHEKIEMLWIESETIHCWQYEYVAGLIVAGRLQQVYKTIN